MKAGTIKMAKSHRINELQEDVMVVDYYLKSTRNKQTKRGLQNLNILLKTSIYNLEKGRL